MSSPADGFVMSGGGGGDRLQFLDRFLPLLHLAVTLELDLATPTVLWFGIISAGFIPVSPGNNPGG